MSIHENEVRLCFRVSSGKILPTAEYLAIIGEHLTDAQTEALSAQLMRQASTL